jgi:biofilm PGA synthesis N-glycosyltransferase PgaC
MELASIKYVIVSPVRDEEKFIERTIRSVLGQAIRPAEWIIVDDGSTDQTAGIVDRYASEHPWIHVVHRSNRGHRQSGGGVVEAFNDGYETIRCRDWDFLVKLDGDLEFDEMYFQNCFERFEREERLGIGGGTICHLENGELRPEECPRFHVRGATKIYRRKCWEEIGGLWQAPGWDTIDELKALMLGWKTETFDDIKVLHQRQTGTAESRWNDLVKNGTARYVAGYHPLFLLASCVLRLTYKPYVIHSAGLLWGYARGYLRDVPQVNDPALIRFVRREQLKRLMGRQTVWN